MTQDQQDILLSKIYSHYGRPSNISTIKFAIYKGWNSNNTQRARVFIYHLVSCPEMGPDKVNIVSYFLKINKNTIRVYTKNCNLDPDLVLDIRE